MSWLNTRKILKWSQVFNGPIQSLPPVAMSDLYCQQIIRHAHEWEGLPNTCNSHTQKLPNRYTQCPKLTFPVILILDLMCLNHASEIKKGGLYNQAGL